MHFGLEQLLEDRHEKSKKEIEDRIKHSLKTISIYGNNDYYAHFMLLEMFKRAEKSQYPKAVLKAFKTAVQKRYPKHFEFVVWDGKGQTIDKLCDEKSYNYIIRKTYTFLKKASQYNNPDSEERRSGTVKTLLQIDKEVKFLRNFLGKFLVTSQLSFPWLSGTLGKPLQTSIPGPRCKIWYRIGEKVGILCFIHSDFFESNAGAEFAIAKVCRENPDFRANITSYPASGKFFPEVDEKLASSLVLALSRFENLDPEQIIEAGGFLIGCNMVGQMKRAVCYCKSSKLFSIDVARKTYLAKSFKFILVFLLVFAIWFKTRNIEYVSIRYKLIILFLYAGGMPILIMSTIGSEYLAQKKQEMVYSAQSNSLNYLRQIDSNFNVFLEDYVNSISAYIDSMNRKYFSTGLPAEKLKELKEHFEKTLNPESIQIFNAQGQLVIPDYDYTIFTDYTILSQMAIGIIKVLNSDDPEAVMAADVVADKFGRDIMVNSRHIDYIGLGARELYRIFDFLGNPEERKCLAIVYLFWRLERLQQIYFEEFERNSGENTRNFQQILVSYSDSTDLVYPKGRVNFDFIKDLGQQARETQILRKNYIELNKKPYYAVAMAGSNLSRLSLILIKPLAEIDVAVERLQKNIYAFIILVILMTLLMFNFLANHFLEPLGKIRSAVEAIGNRNFSHRISTEAGNEFGELAETFNTTLEAMEELEVARIVQENLLPGNKFFLDRVELIAFYRPFSKIGGDYFDFFSPGPETVLIFIGDVAGHGISAALIMAMAKSVMICERNNFLGSEHLMSALNVTLFKNRRAGNKEYMTGMLIDINTTSGEMAIINSGHCMPLKVSDKGNSIEAIKCGGLPLGFDVKSNFVPVKLQLKPGDTIILYTDGFIESKNSSGEMLGLEKLMKMAHKTWNSDLSKFQNDFLKSHDEWSEEKNDDQTFLLIRYV
ncbi:MAG: hypothetical protein Kow0029_19540 [Candidatus Rifleibacteriota bacterium]